MELELQRYLARIDQWFEQAYLSGIGFTLLALIIFFGVSYREPKQLDRKVLYYTKIQFILMLLILALK